MVRDLESRTRLLGSATRNTGLYIARLLRLVRAAGTYASGSLIGQLASSFSFPQHKKPTTREYGNWHRTKAAAIGRVFVDQPNWLSCGTIVWPNASPASGSLPADHRPLLLRQVLELAHSPELGIALVHQLADGQLLQFGQMLDDR
jgi:hypothetical protein